MPAPFTPTVPTDLAGSLREELRDGLCKGPAATHVTLDVVAALVAAGDGEAVERAEGTVGVDDLLVSLEEVVASAAGGWGPSADAAAVEYARGVLWALGAVRSAQRRQARQAALIEEAGGRTGSWPLA